MRQLFVDDTARHGDISGGERESMAKSAHKHLDRHSVPSGRASMRHTTAKFARATPVWSEPLPTNLPPTDRTDLLETIEAQIIPHLVLTHHRETEGKGQSASLCADARPPPTELEVQQLAEIATQSDLTRALGMIEKMGADGLSLEIVLLQLVAPAARRLGDEWLTDERSFSEVTIGLSTLQQIVQILGPSFAPSAGARGEIVLVSPLSEQHTLGIYLLGEFLRREGWGVRVAPSLSETDLLSIVADEHIEMVGISVACEEALKDLERFVAVIRKVSLNRDVLVMVGGVNPALPAHAKKLGIVYCDDPHETVRRLDEHARQALRT